MIMDDKNMEMGLSKDLIFNIYDDRIILWRKSEKITLYKTMYSVLFKIISQKVFFLKDMSKKQIGIYEFYKKNDILQKSNGKNYILNHHALIIGNYILNTETWQFVELSNEEIDNINNKRFFKVDKDKLDELIFSNILYSIKCGGKKYKYRDIFNIYIIFSYKCNMRCTYCFEEDKSFKKEIDIEYIDKVIDFSLRNRTIITLYGGEPLLRKNYKKIKYLFQRIKPKQKIRIITNGVNINSYQKLLQEYKNNIIEIVVTIDGPKEIHNERRKYKDDSFHIITNNISVLLNERLPICIRINLDRRNFSYQIELLKILNCMYGEFNKHLKIEYHLVERKGDVCFNPIPFEELYDAYFSFKKTSLFQISFEIPFLRGIQNYLNYTYNNKCDGVCNINQNKVVNPDGKIYICNEAMQYKEFCSGSDLCNINKVFFNNKMCKNCCVYELCYGNCLYENYIVNGDINTPVCRREKLYNILSYHIDNFKKQDRFFWKKIYLLKNL